MDGPLRWVVAIVVVAALIGLVTLARGEPFRGEPDAPTAVTTTLSLEDRA
jgi:hypothetical protein